MLISISTSILHPLATVFKAELHEGYLARVVAGLLSLPLVLPSYTMRQQASAPEILTLIALV
jgi:hypothetical protein